MSLRIFSSLRFCLVGAFVLALFVNSWGEDRPKTVYYSHAGNYKAWVSYPEAMRSARPYPVVIYNYDEFIDWVGPTFAAKKGYDIFAIMKQFNKWGMICIVPQERHHKLNALKGAIAYARRLPSAGPLYLVGVSEGAFLSLLALENAPDVSRVVTILPVAIHDTGKLSLSELLRRKEIAKVPMLLIVGTAEKKFRTRDAHIIQRIYSQNAKPALIKAYHEKRDWFWKSDQVFMWDIYMYLMGTAPPVEAP